MAGLAISKTRTALAHSMSYPITARYRMPHGLACSFTLPAVLDFNAQVDDGRLKDVAEKLGFKSVPAMKDQLAKLLTILGVGASLKEYVASVDELTGLASEMLTPARAENNLRAASVDDVRAIMSESWKLYADF